MALITTKDLTKNWNDKRFSTDFVTPSALEILKKSSVVDLEYEHLIPKKKYIQDICERKVAEVNLTVNFVSDIINKYLWTATVTKQEHKLLTRRIIPVNWDEENIMARYEDANIVLFKHRRDYFY